MLSRGPVIDPFLARERKFRISSSISIPIGWLTELKRHADDERVSFSDIVLRALETYGADKEIDLFPIDIK